MTQHDWSEEDFDWKALSDACWLFQLNMQKYARYCLHTKEKYGTMRLEFVGMGHRGLYGLLHPGDLYFRWKGPTIHLKYPKSIRKYFEEERRPVLLSRLFNDLTETFARITGLSWLFWRYQRLVFNLITLYAIRKWPHIKDEIMDELEFRELLYSWVKKKVNYINNWKTIE